MNISRLIILILIGLLSGCASILSDFNEVHGEGEFNRRVGGREEICRNYYSEIYEGTKMDTQAIGDCLVRGGGFWGPLCLLAVPFPIIDLPFALVADTVIAPYTHIKNAYDRGVYRNNDGDICDLRTLFDDAKKLNADKQKIVINDASIEKYDLTGAIFNEAEFEKTRWNSTTGKNMSFTNTNFKNSTFKQVNFGNSTFTDVTFEYSEFDETSFKLSKLSGVKFNHCKFKGKTDFANLKSSNVELYDSTLDGVSFADAEATLDFSGSTLKNVQLTGLTAPSALYFNNSKLENVDIDRSKLSTLQMELCTFYKNSKVAPSDYVMGWYQKAAEQDESGGAYFLLGDMFHEGDGVKTEYLKDMDKTGFINKIDFINKDYADSFRDFGASEKSTSEEIWFDFRSKEQISHEGNVPKDLNQALMWYQKAAERNNPSAQLRLGYMYEKGEVVPKNLALAVAWYQKSAEQNESFAQASLGKAYMKGEGIGKNPARAYAWLILATNAEAPAVTSRMIENWKNDCVKQITPTERAEGERLAKNWKKGDTLLHKTKDGS